MAFVVVLPQSVAMMTSKVLSPSFCKSQPPGAEGVQNLKKQMAIYSPSLHL